MSITQWPASERPREKLRQQGAAALSDAELLAILLRTGSRGKSVIELAHELLKRFSGLHGILSADFASLMQVSGLGLSKITQLQAAIELTKRYAFSSLQQQTMLKTTLDAKRFLQIHLHDLKKEVMLGLFLNNQHQVICCEQLASGTVNQCAIYYREIIKRVLHHNATALVLAHNHPAGNILPSEDDRMVTKELKKLLQILDVKLLDHIIVAHNKCISFAECGMLG